MLKVDIAAVRQPRLPRVIATIGKSLSAVLRDLSRAPLAGTL
jgi:hypothetical protein